MKQSTLPNRTTEIVSAGPHPLTLTPVCDARKESTEISKRMLSARTKQSTEIVKMISGKTDESFLTQTSTIVRSLDQVSREKIIDNLDVKVSIPTEHSAAMKANLSISWNLMRNIRSWLHTFKIKLAPEGKTRKLTKEWVGGGMRSEHAPLFINKGKVQPPAWCYLYNLVGHILKRLNDFEEAKLITSHQFIPEDEVWLKIGGDPGGKSLK